MTPKRMEEIELALKRFQAFVIGADLADYKPAENILKGTSELLTEVKANQWHKVEDKLPPEELLVIGWDDLRFTTLVRYWKHKDYPNGQYWNVNGCSGGIGTKFEVVRPTHWKYVNPPEGE